MRIDITHTTRYRFETPAFFGLQQLRKTPKSGRGQQIIAWETRVTGGQKQVAFEDHHHNSVETISFEKGTTELTVTSTGAVEMAETHGITGKHIGPAPLWLYEQSTALTRPGAAVRKLARSVDGEGDLERLHALLAAIREAVAYEIGVSHPGWTAEDALAQGRGVCQDHAHVFLACAREMGFPARYVSGYLMLNDRIEQDAMHAWAEAHVDGLGWVGFDPSNGISPDARYVRVATGLDYSDAAPVTGLRVGGTGEALSVEIEVAQQ